MNLDGLISVRKQTQENIIEIDHEIKDHIDMKKRYIKNHIPWNSTPRHMDIGPHDNFSSSHKKKIDAIVINNQIDLNQHGTFQNSGGSSPISPIVVQN